MRLKSLSNAQLRGPSLASAAAGLALGLSAFAQSSPTYADVAPILVGRCAKCHTENGLRGAAPEGYLLNSYGATISAVDRGRVVPRRAS